MPRPQHSSDTDRAEPKLAAPGPRSVAEPLPLRRTASGHGRDPADPALRAPQDRRITGLTAGERLTVASAITGGDDEARRRRPGMLTLFLVVVLIVFAGIGAASVYHSVAGAFPH
jgi:hypothetical protein